MGDTSFKSDRLLIMYSQLLDGKVLNKKELAEQFQVSPRSIQRDIEVLRCFFAERHLQQEVVYDKDVGGFHLLEKKNQMLSNSEILAVCKILLESRSLRRDEMLPLLDKLVEGCVPEQNKNRVKDLVANEELYYVEPHHGKAILGRLWEIGQAVQGQKVMEIEYDRLKSPNRIMRTVEPVGIMFSEYYFYLIAFLRDPGHKRAADDPASLSPAIYRIDRIHSFKNLNERFFTPYRNRFEEGQFRKRVQFMYGGKLEHIKFRYTGPSIEAVLDRLPPA